MPALKIKSCPHCASKAEIVCEPIGPDDHYIVGWECSQCRASTSTVVVKDMVEYGLRKMGMQWNMRAEIKVENFTAYNRAKPPC